jgi:hypothetical protein
MRRKKKEIIASIYFFSIIQLTIIHTRKVKIVIKIIVRYFIQREREREKEIISRKENSICFKKQNIYFILSIKLIEEYS